MFLSGVLFLIVSLTRLREWVINSIPLSLKLAIAAGIGLFLAIIGLNSAGIIQASPATRVPLGNLKSPTVVPRRPDGRLPRVSRALAVDSTAAMGGAAIGTSTTTSYIESAAGVNAGRRSGLVAVTVAVLFLGGLFFAPLARAIPAFATALALVYVALSHDVGCKRGQFQ